MDGMTEFSRRVEIMDPFTIQIKFSDTDLAKVSDSKPGALALYLFTTKQLSYGNCTETKERWYLWTIQYCRESDVCVYKHVHATLLILLHSQ